MPTHMTKRGQYVLAPGEAVTTLVINTEVVAEFKELVRRGANTFERASPETKEFVDLLLFGYAQQDYHSMPQFRGSEHGKREGTSSAN